MELLFDRFSKTFMVTESVDVVPIRHRNSYIPYIGSGTDTVDNGLFSWESLVDITHSLLMLLLYFILFEYLGRGNSRIVHSTKFIKLNCLVLYSYKFIIFYLIFNI